MFKIRQKLIAVLLVVIVISVVAPTIILNSETNKEVKIEYANTLKSHIESFLLYYNSSNLNPFEVAKKYGEATGLRVTLIDSKGVVIGESNISKDEIVLEGVGNSYTKSNFISSATSRSTVLAWTNHQLQWRNDASFIPTH